MEVSEIGSEQAKPLDAAVPAGAEAAPDLGAGTDSEPCASGSAGIEDRAAVAAAEAAGIASVLAPGACSGGADLTGLSDSDARTVLVAQTARFTASFLRWMETQTIDGMSYPRLRLLQALHRGGPAIMRDLGTQLGATPRNMTAMVDALEDAHLVVRRPHPTDRRATLIELSPDGVREAQQELGPRLDAMAEIFAGLSPAERQHFSGVMSKLMRAIRDRQRAC
jgi:DNA-binding MarR family transcriptional regulator